MAGRAELPGSGSTSVDHELAIVRYLPNGELDTSFDDDGKVLVDLGGVDDEPLAARALPVASGKIVVAGTVGERIFAFRLQKDGMRDLAFGYLGAAYIDIPDMRAKAWDARVDSQGRIVLAGRATVKGSGYALYLLARLTAGGSKDSSFAGGGATYFDFGSEGQLLTSLSLDGQGDLICSGGFGPQMLAARFSANGAHKMSVAKWLSLANFEVPAFAFGDSEGRIVLVGYATKLDGF
ncbi:MAG: hypothetical protein QM778_27860 [Myxococcales bacterium]